MFKNIIIQWRVVNKTVVIPVILIFFKNVFWRTFTLAICSLQEPFRKQRMCWQILTLILEIEMKTKRLGNCCRSSCLRSCSAHQHLTKGNMVLCVCFVRLTFLFDFLYFCFVLFCFVCLFVSSSNYYLLFFSKSHVSRCCIRSFEKRFAK